jgi:hypothetical protein
MLTNDQQISMLARRKLKKNFLSLIVRYLQYNKTLLKYICFRWKMLDENVKTFYIYIYHIAQCRKK